MSLALLTVSINHPLTILIDYCFHLNQVMAAIEKINEQDVDPSVADVVDTENWSKEEMQEGDHLIQVDLHSNVP